MKTFLLRIEAPHFVAGIIFDENGQCIKAAPIVKWCRGLYYPEVDVRIKARNWKIHWCRNGEPRQ